MEKIINFSGPILKRRDRNITSTYISDSSSKNKDEESLSPIYTKKSHFYGNKKPDQELKTNFMELSEAQANEILNETNQLELEETETNNPKGIFFNLFFNK